MLDPMNGSGTTTLESYLLERRGIGCDIDPLATKIARVKATPVEIDTFELVPDLIKSAYALLQNDSRIERALKSRFDLQTKQFIDYWFFPETTRELMALILTIEDFERGSAVRELLEAVFSSIIVTKSGGVSRARDLAHSRAHIDHTKQPKNAIMAFEQRLRKFAPIISGLPNHLPRVEIKQCNAKKIDIERNSVDLIVTSPPYANAIDYVRANKFSLVWFGETVSSLSQLRRSYIGSEATGNSVMESLPYFTEQILSELRDKDKKKEMILRKYYLEMREVMREIQRVLIAGCLAVLVVGTSTMRGIDVKTPRCLADVAENEVGFTLEGVLHRFLDRDRRMLPFAKGQKTAIEQRMGTEEILVLKK